LQTEIVQTSIRLAEVGPAWDALWQRAGQYIFQSHGWVSAWWTTRQAEDQSRLCIGLCWAGDSLVAVLPFATRRHRGVRVLEWAAKDCSDYCDAVVTPDLAEGGRALEQVWAAVAATAGFDLVYLSHIRPDAALRGLLDRQPPALRLRRGRRSAISRQVHRHGPDGQAWFQGLDEAARNSHAQGMQAVSEMGPVRSELYRPGDAADALIDRMIGLKRQLLASSGQSYAILDNGALTFRALAKELARQDALRIFGLHCGEHLVAALLNVASGTRMQVFFAAYDPRFERAAPETLALTELLIRAFDMGIKKVDLLCVEADDKYTFTNAQVDLASYVGAKTLIGKLALTVGEWLERRR
jgi:CelD/BcsL family acetyltransferase involved in cellulose biosynthesis